jgi:hypothetical protein
MKKMDTTELQADRDSDCLIAKRLGLSVKYRGTMQHPILFIDDGNVFGPELPHYTTDLDAAILLCRGIPLTIRNQFGNLWYATIANGLDPDNNYVGLAIGKSALAVCRAWLAWMDRREE